MTDYEKLVDQLRWNATEYQGCIFEDEDRQMCADAADAIEALQAQLPKRGEWKPVYYDNKPLLVECSICGAQLLGKVPYCPYCGAKMTEVQDG